MKDKNKYFIQNGMISRFDFMDNQEFLPLPTVCALLNDNEEKYDKLAEKFVIVSKALELACKNSAFEDTCDYCEYKSYGHECPCYCESEQDFDKTQAIRYFTNKAKEIINGHKQDD
jgi:hypothetical protein